MNATSRLTGMLVSWTISATGGFGRVVIIGTQRQFFLHSRAIRSGDPIPGSFVTFTPAPPLEGKKDPRATEAIITKGGAR